MKKVKELNGAELASYIKERQVRTVRGLRQAWGIKPKLAIITTTNSPVIDTYMNLKKNYGSDIDVDVEIYRVRQDMLPELLDEVNKDSSIHGVVVQLPLERPQETDALLALIPRSKDVDGLGPDSTFTPATAEAINWLLSGYNIELRGKKIALLGGGRLVGAPLAKLWEESDYIVETVDISTENSKEILLGADVIVAATGTPGVLSSEKVSQGTVVVDAGTTSEGGKIVGDVAQDVRERLDIAAITPTIGGVGPLTIAALFENLLIAARGQKGDIAEEA